MRKPDPEGSGEIKVMFAYGGGPDGAKGFKCPNCKEHVILER